MKRLNEEFIKVTRHAEILRIVAPQATDLLLTTPDEFQKMIAEDTARLSKIIREAGINAQQAQGRPAKTKRMRAFAARIRLSSRP